MTSKFCIPLATLATIIFSNMTLAADPPVIRFGSTMTLTGSSGPWAKNCQNGALMATDDVNAAGGIQGAKLELIIEDYGEMDLKRAVTAAHRLLDVKGVSALLPIWSEDTEVISPIGEKYDRIVMTLGAGGPRAARFSQSTFRATTSDGELAKLNVKDELSRGAKNACLLVSDSSYYVDIAADIEEAWKAGGGVIAFRESTPYVPTEVRSVVTKLRSVSCDSIFVWTAPAGLGPLIKELEVQNIRGNRILPWWGASEDIVNVTVGGKSSYRLNRFILRNEDFISRYKKKFGEAPVRPAGNCYDGIRILAHVMNKVGPDRIKVREALLGLNNYVGVTGPFKIRPDREREGEYIEKMEILNGKLQPVL